MERQAKRKSTSPYLYYMASQITWCILGIYWAVVEPSPLLLRLLLGLLYQPGTIDAIGLYR